MPRKLRTLILEDRPEDAELVLRELRRSDIDPEFHIIDNELGFVQALAFPWDVILADYRMPHFDAFAALDILRREHVTTPLIVITATLGDEGAAACIKRGAADYLLKDRLARLGPAVLQAVDDTKMRSERQRAVEQVQTLVDCAPFAIIGMGTDFSVMTWSKAAERIFGYTAAEVVGKPYNLVPDEYRDESGGGGLKAIREGETVTNQPVRRKHKDGRILDIVISGSPLRDTQGGIIGAVYVMEDVTEKRKVEQKLVQAQKMEAVGQLTGGIAHDFNNILGVVVGNLDQQAEYLTDRAEAAVRYEKVKSLGQAALNAALRGAELVKRLLAFSRNQPLQPKVLDLGKIASDIEPLLRRTIGDQITVKLEVQHGLWPVMADPSQFESAVLNLAINARDAMPSGGRLRIACNNTTLDDDAAKIEEVAAGDYVTVTVSDSGTGIPAELLSRVFEPFFTTKEVGKGSGLGLSMVFGFARQSGGTVKIYSEVGLGTDVRIYFPRGADKTGAAPGPRTGSTTALPGGKERVLIVEDKPDVREMAVELLNSLGYKTIEAGDATAALAVLDRGEAIDLLFSDLVMPGMNGLALAREVRKRLPTLPVIFATGFADPEAIRVEATALDAIVIRKPFRKAELAQMIRETLERPVSV